MGDTITTKADAIEIMRDYADMMEGDNYGLLSASADVRKRGDELITVLTVVFVTHVLEEFKNASPDQLPALKRQHALKLQMAKQRRSLVDAVSTVDAIEAIHAGLLAKQRRSGGLGLT